MGSIEVNILGQQYKIIGDAREEYIQELALFVNKKIEEIINKNPNIAPLKAAFLAAFNIADELYNYKREQENLTENIKAKTEELDRLFE